MVADAGAKARQYRERRAALAATRPVRFVYVPDGSEPPASAYAVKRISFIRHGQGEHNLHDEQWTAANKPGNPYGPGACSRRRATASSAVSWPSFGSQRCASECRHAAADKLAELPHLVDPALTAKGVEQARALQSAASAMHPAPELIVVSPMRRAVDTALLAFAHVFDDPAVAHAVPVRRSDLRPAVSIVGHELCRESYARSEKTPVQTPQPQGNICDKRRPLEQIAADYPYIDWALVNDGPTDVVYERGGEDMDSFVERMPPRWPLDLF